MGSQTQESRDKPEIQSGIVVTRALPRPRSENAYRIEKGIEVPAIRDISPSVVLTYSSHAGNDIAGVGWRLDATSSIVRTGADGGVSGPSIPQIARKTPSSPSEPRMSDQQRDEQ
jgi:hypothetical protein